MKEPKVHKCRWCLSCCWSNGVYLCFAHDEAEVTDAQLDSPTKCPDWRFSPIDADGEREWKPRRQLKPRVKQGKFDFGGVP